MTQVHDRPRTIRFSEELRAFLDEVMPVVIGTTRRDDSVQMNPIWYDRDGDRIRLNPTVSRRWGKRLEPGASVTLLFLDPGNMWRWAEIRGRVVSKTLEGGEAHIDLLSRRYLGRDYTAHDPHDPRQVVVVEPEQIGGTFDEGEN
ncbi:MAG TPA: pyridoxamine 5'-phosphate oxidase family protein [Vitreimonas sp.]|nr:pyridoxamine 5'-phosphate oxidase family protein [Vitreimonas sp.]